MAASINHARWCSGPIIMDTHTPVLGAVCATNITALIGTGTGNRKKADKDNRVYLPSLTFNRNTEQFRKEVIAQHFTAACLPAGFRVRIRNWDKRTNTLRLICPHGRQRSKACNLKCPFMILLYFEPTPGGSSDSGLWYFLNNGKGNPVHEGHPPEPPCYQQHPQQQQHILRNKEIGQKFPHTLLKLCTEPHDGNVSYGTHAGLLNFQPTIPGGTGEAFKIGFASIGWVYENDAKTKYYGKPRCNDSERQSDFLEKLRISLLEGKHIMGSPEDNQLRCQFIKGAYTLRHVDSFRGVSSNYFLFHKSGLTLCVDHFPAFKTSVVSYNNKLYIPHVMKAASGFICLLGLDDSKEDGSLLYHCFPDTILEQLRPVATLPVAVVGIVGKGRCLLQYISLQAGQDQTLASPSLLPQASFQQVLQWGKPDTTIPVPRYSFFSEPHVWHVFQGWRFCHFATGNGMIHRTNLFSRFIREPCGAQNLVQGKTVWLEGATGTPVDKPTFPFPKGPYY